MLKEITIQFRIEASDEVQVFLGKLLDREIEASVRKAFKKVLDKKTVKELVERKILIPTPCILFTKDGTVQRIATEESSGDETAVGTKQE